MCKAQALRQPENGLSVGAPLCMRAAFVVFMPLRQPEKGEKPVFAKRKCLPFVKTLLYCVKAV
jgi:hypothetical protein